MRWQGVPETSIASAAVSMKIYLITLVKSDG
jgi:hypothetical protein